MYRSALTSMVAVASLLALNACAGPTGDGGVTGTEALDNGNPATGHPSAGYLIYSISLGSGGSYNTQCGAVLVAPNAVLTTADCIGANAGGLGGTLYFPHASFSTTVTPAEIIVHPNYKPLTATSPSLHDVALIRLPGAVPGIAPALIAAPALNQPGIIIGYTPLSDEEENLDAYAQALDAQKLFQVAPAPSVLIFFPTPGDAFYMDGLLAAGPQTILGLATAIPRGFGGANPSATFANVGEELPFVQCSEAQGATVNPTTLAACMGL
jgi:hypothetical protein